MIRTIILIAVLLISHLQFAQADFQKLDEYFDALEAADKFMGSVAVSNDGKLIYSRSLGFSNVEKKKEANADTKYRIGSISKTFTAVLILKAVEEAKLNPEQNLSEYFPEIPNANKITLAQLLHHQSGIHNFTDNPEYLTWNTEPKSREEMLDIIIKGGSDFEPGVNTEYSNSNYVLLSFILEEVYKKPYSKLLESKILKPLKLKNTTFGGKINSDKNEALSYQYFGKWQLQPETDMSIPLGAGGIVSTPKDINIFAQALFDGKLLKKESLEQMKKMENGFGMGLFEIPFYDKIGFGHTGGIDGFASVFAYFPEDKIAYSLTSNEMNYDNNAISIAVLSAVFGNDFQIPDFTTYEVTAEDLDKYLGTYASEVVPLKITITKEENVLIAQATGQASFPLESTAENIFKFDLAGVVLEFNPEENSMILKQGGMELEFVKE